MCVNVQGRDLRGATITCSSLVSGHQSQEGHGGKAGMVNKSFKIQSLES